MEPEAVCRPRHRCPRNHTHLRRAGQPAEQHPLPLRQVDGHVPRSASLRQGPRHRDRHVHGHGLALRRSVGALGGKRLQGSRRRHHVCGWSRHRLRPVSTCQGQEVLPSVESHGLWQWPHLRRDGASGGRTTDVVAQGDADRPEEGHQGQRCQESAESRGQGHRRHHLARHGPLCPLRCHEGEARRSRWRRVGDRPLRPQGCGQLPKAHRGTF